MKSRNVKLINVSPDDRDTALDIADRMPVEYARHIGRKRGVIFVSGVNPNVTFYAWNTKDGVTVRAFYEEYGAAA